MTFNAMDTQMDPAGRSVLVMLYAVDSDKPAEGRWTVAICWRVPSAWDFIN